MEDRSKNRQNKGFPGGAVIKNPPANAGDRGLSPGPGRPHMLRSSSARAPQLLSLRSRACEPQLLSPRATTTEAQDFPGGAVVKKPPANARDTGSIPGAGRAHMPRSNKACVPQLLSPCSRVREPQLLKPMCLEPALGDERSHRNEKPTHCDEE
ncbi:hypothetical protein J1605_017086 [Eschrichtius robustus]|uniref:Uncharacterized protein n=1 Tax=Eschrichtius robustus TaxID=9764 RepID=A0AB34I5R3_ESCRO|nr:hypothetical protein J1605_017086 [Eschrichtius robustus]